MINLQEIYKDGYEKGYKEGFAKAVKFLERQPPKLDIIINVSAKEIDEITETEKDLEDALNTVNNYKKLLFGE